MEKKGAFDYILLETTGLADPGNLAPLFWVDDGLGSTIYLDGIVTLVDAKNIIQSLDDPAQSYHLQQLLQPQRQQNAGAGTLDSAQSHGHFHHGPVMTTAHVQLSHADVIVVNKSDLVSESELQAVLDRIESINELAKVHVTKRSEVPTLQGFLLDLHAYDQVSEIDARHKGHSHLDPAISTIAVPVPTLSLEQVDAVDAWLRSLLWQRRFLGSGSNTGKGESELDIHRVKGRLVLDSGAVKMIQGVRDIFEIMDSADRAGDGTLVGKIVLIGRDLDGEAFERDFAAAIAR
jgi:G3E family GTPase